MIFLAGQIPSPQSGELTLILEELIEIASDDHIKINIELFPLYFEVEKGDFAPPFFPSLLKRLNIDVLI